MKPKNKQGLTFHQYLERYFTTVLVNRIKNFSCLRRCAKRKWKRSKEPYF